MSDAKPAQPSPYSASSRDVVPSHHAAELGALVAELSADSLEVVLLVARRLARAEERT